MDVTLRTERLVLRPPRLSDAEAVARGLDNFGVAGNLARVPYPYGLEDARHWLRTRREGLPAEETGFAITVDGGETYIGQVGFHREGLDPVIGYWLAEPWWGKGIMTEAAGAAIDWFFAASAAPAIRSGVFAFNQASLNVQKKLGFVEISRSVRHCLARRADLSHIDTELTRARWAERRR
jgi:RimJ/RimL family protein N-acetyltransferase